MRTLVCGSLAFDTIMVFPDHFSRHILPEQAHVLSVSFTVGEMRREWGGCAGNIAYNLKHIGGEPVVMATVGDDGDDYRERLAAFGIGVDTLRQVPGTYTAQAFIITDLDDNQITAFHPGAMNFSHQNRVSDARDIGLGIVAPDGKEGMSSHVEQFASAGIPFLFDPGQGIPLFSGPELLAMVEKAQYVAVNDYEGRMLVGAHRRAARRNRGEGRRTDRHARRRRLGHSRRQRHVCDSGGQARRRARSHRVWRRLSRGHPLWARAGLGLAAHGRPRIGAGRDENCVSRRAEPRGQPGDGGSAVPRHVRRASVVTSRLESAEAPLAPKRTNSRVVQCYRWTRTCVHVLAGVATTLFVFPLVSDAGRRTLVKRWSVRLLRILRVEMRIDGDIGTHRGNVMVVANHISWLDIFVLNAAHPVRFVAKAEIAKWPVLSQMVRGAGTVFIERERPRDMLSVNHKMAQLLAQGNVVAVFPEGTTTFGRELLPFKGALLQPIVEAEGHVQPVAIRYRTPDGDHSRRAGLRGRHVVRGVVLVASAASARSQWSWSRGPRCPRATAIGATSRAWRKRLSERLWLDRRPRGNLIQPPVREPDAGKRPAPHAAGIEHQHVRRQHEVERRPVPADNRRDCGAPVRMRKPCLESCRACFRVRASRPIPSCRRPCRSAAACTR